MPLRILVADDDSTIRLLLRRILETHLDWMICGEAVDGIDAIQKVIALEPDVVILDLSMPRMSGMQASREITRSNPAVRTLLLTVQEILPAIVPSILDAGFKGAVTKENGMEIVHAVEAVLRGEIFFYPPIAADSDATLARGAGQI